MAENRISPELLDRINQFAGAGAVSDQEMAMMQGAAPTMPTAPMPMTGSGAISDQEMRMYEAGAAGMPTAPMPMMGSGAVSDQELMMMQQAGEEDLGARIQQLIDQMQASDDVDEQKQLAKTIERLQLGANAPLADQALMIQEAGTGEDTVLAHLSPGEVVLPPQFLEDPEFESMIEKKFMDAGIDPQEAVAGVGIASLNQMTGLEEFGFFKKIGKALKKVAKKIAPIAGPLANFIPGVGPLVAGAIGAATNVAAGKGLKGAISGGLGGYTFGKALTGIGSLGGTSAADFAKKGLVGKIQSVGGGLASLPGEGFLGKTYELFMPGQDQTGLFGNLRKAGGYIFGTGPDGQPFFQPDPTATTTTTPTSTTTSTSTTTPTTTTTAAQPQGSALSRFLSGMFPGGAAGAGLAGGLGSLAGFGLAGTAALKLGKLAMEEAKKDKGVPLTPLITMDAGGRYNIEAEIARRMGKAPPNPVEFGLQPAFPTLSGGQAGPRKDAVSSQYVMQAAEGGAVDVEMTITGEQIQEAIELVKLAEDLPRLKDEPAYQAALNLLGASGILSVNPTPLVPGAQLGFEQGKLANTRAGMRAGRAVAALGKTLEDTAKFGPGEPISKMYGGPVMAYAQGGAVAMQEGGELDPNQFPRMNGYIEGPGTETSDDIPAMLSDGEFVMTGQAVRGAGSFQLNEEPNGILTLVPSASESRERGTQLMYQMMDVFGRYANATS